MKIFIYDIEVFAYDWIVDIKDTDTLEHTTISPALYKKKLKDDWYISDKEQVEYGIVEKLIDNIEELY